MASVSSLDKDLRNLRLDKYTPQRASQVRQWIEETLGEHLQQGDLLEALKDGIALCKLINLATPGGVKFKDSKMPFVQMENISHFLRACQAPPLNLQAHDCFLTVDLYESKDPAQVLQCIEAFSRVAITVQPARFKKAIGGRKSAVSPQRTGPNSNGGSSFSHARGGSKGSEPGSVGGRTSPFKAGTTSPPGNSSWAKSADIGSTAPAWNIAQYGWTGGASQGNQGIAFGARRQITSAAPNVPSLAEKERRRREEEAEAGRRRIQAEEEERKRRAEQEAEEERAKVEEERRWEEETRKLKEKERRDVEEEKRRWEEQERKWKDEEQIRLREEKEAEARLSRERQQKAAGSDSRLKGQFLSQFQAEKHKQSAERERVKELERQLEEAKERERQYERERQERLRSMERSPAPEPVSLAAPSTGNQFSPEPTPDPEEDSFQQDSERDYLRQEWSNAQSAPAQPPRPLPVPKPKPSSSNQFASPSPRPLPNPAAYASQTSTPNRTEQYLSSNPAPPPAAVSSHTPSEAMFNSESERAAEDARRAASQNKTKAGGWASKSLLEREMERERQRQQEWEESQRQTKEAAERGAKDPSAGTGPGQSWDVNSYGFTRGDNLNKGGGVYSGRRQILGPRPFGSKGT